MSVFEVILVRIFQHSERWGETLRIQSECEKIRTRITPNTDTFYAVYVPKIFRNSNISYTLIRTRFIYPLKTCAFQRIRNVSFSGNSAYILNWWLLHKDEMLLEVYTGLHINLWKHWKRFQSFMVRQFQKARQFFTVTNSSWKEFPLLEFWNCMKSFTITKHVWKSVFEKRIYDAVKHLWWTFFVKIVNGLSSTMECFAKIVNGVTIFAKRSILDDEPLTFGCLIES